MSEQADLVRARIAAWNRGELEAMFAGADPDAEWVVAREHPAATTHHGPEAVRAYLEDWLQTMPGLQIEIDALEESGNKVLLLTRMRGGGARSGAAPEVAVATVTTFREGKIVRVEEFLDPDEARRAAGLA